MSVFNTISSTTAEKEEAYYQLAVGYARAKLWPDARAAADEMRVKFPNGKLTPKAYTDAGYAARDAKNKGEETYFLSTALTVFPNAVEVAGAQFELAWLKPRRRKFCREFNDVRRTPCPLCRERHDESRQGWLLGSTRFGTGQQNGRRLQPLRSRYLSVRGQLVRLSSSAATGLNEVAGEMRTCHPVANNPFTFGKSFSQSAYGNSCAGNFRAGRTAACEKSPTS